MEYRRKSRRFTINLKAHYFQKEKKGDGKECTVINISRNGAGLELYTSERIAIGLVLLLDFALPDAKEHTHVEGIVRWVKQGKKDFIGGVEATSKSDVEKLEDLIMLTLGYRAN